MVISDPVMPVNKKEGYNVGGQWLVQEASPDCEDCEGLWGRGHLSWEFSDVKEQSWQARPTWLKQREAKRLGKNTCPEQVGFAGKESRFWLLCRGWTFSRGKGKTEGELGRAQKFNWDRTMVWPEVVVLAWWNVVTLRMCFRSRADNTC